MAPFTRWLPASPERSSDIVIEVAGDGNGELAKGTTALEQGLADQGLEVLAQTERLDGIGPATSVRLRVSVDPLSSTGSGCDVLVYLGRKLPPRNSFHLQRGSVLLCDARSMQDASPPAIPEGVIVYPVPFADLHHRHGRHSEKEVIAIGVLSRLLGMSEEIIRRRLRPDFRAKYFDIGVNWASTHLQKRDICAFPSPPLHPHRQVILNAHQVVGLGLEMGNCNCGPVCVQHLEQSPEEWISDHVSASWNDIASPMIRNFMAQEAYRNSHANVLALLGVHDPTIVREDDAAKAPLVLVPANLPDALRCMVGARRLARADTPVWVIVDDLLTCRSQSVPLPVLEEVAGKAAQLEGRGEPSKTCAPDWLCMAEREGDAAADVGFVTWGASQGVVREAVAFCRSFGLKVAALYPKVLRPLPEEALRAFSETVNRLIVVEPDRALPYTRLIAVTTSLRLASIVPEPGQPLTPMDIFLREDLGGCTPAKTQ
ncbi:MAG: hypothetical protein AABZ51_03200 [Nitrospirota bacterium]